MKTIPVVKAGEGILPLDQALLANAQRVVCDGVNWHVYEHGDAIPEKHTHEAMTAAKPAAAAKKKK